MIEAKSLVGKFSGARNGVSIKRKDHLVGEGYAWAEF